MGFGEDRGGLESLWRGGAAGEQGRYSILSETTCRCRSRGRPAGGAAATQSRESAEKQSQERRGVPMPPQKHRFSRKSSERLRGLADL